MHPYQIAVAKAIAAKDGTKAKPTQRKPKLKRARIGDAEMKRLAAGTKRAIQIADCLDGLITARDGDNPQAAALATQLLANPQFVAAFQKLISSVGASLPKPAPDAVAPPKPSEQAGPDYEETGANNAPVSPDGSKLPGTDSAMAGAAGAAGPYTVDQLKRDLATQNGAIARLAKTMGMDAAIQRVNASPLVPPWDTPWTPEARQYLSERALGDGWAAAHINPIGDLYERFGQKEEPKRNPRDYDR